MYRMHKNSQAASDQALLPEGCFDGKAKYSLWVLGIIASVAIIYAVVVLLYRQGPVYSATGQSFPQGGQLQNMASVKCPYCPGILDAQGRCNVRPCPIYSPNWGKPSSSKGIPVKQLLIRELALEVGASQGKASVVIQSVYISGNAEKAGLKAGDKILRFNGRKVKNVRQFESIVARAKPEAEVRIETLRKGEKIKTLVMVGEGEMEGATPPPATNAP